MRRIIITTLFALMLTFLLSASCGCTVSLNGITQLFNPDCFVDGALTQEEYDDLSVLERLLYTKNSCDLYVERDVDNTLDDLFD